jgi:hypothetical protein
VITAMMAEGVLAGLCLQDFTAELIADAERVLLVAVTEKRTEAELDKYVQLLGHILEVTAGVPV